MEKETKELRDLIDSVFRNIDDEDFLAAAGERGWIIMMPQWNTSQSGYIGKVRKAKEEIFSQECEYARSYQSKANSQNLVSP